MVNYSKIKVLELKQDLMDSGLSEETIESLNKKELIDLHKQNTSMLDRVNMDEEFEEVDDVVLQEEYDATMDPEAPPYNSREWSDYVMTKFDKSELIDGNPICAGLRRVSETMLGTVVESGPEQVFPSTDPN